MNGGLQGRTRLLLSPSGRRRREPALITWWIVLMIVLLLHAAWWMMGLGDQPSIFAAEPVRDIPAVRYEPVAGESESAALAYAVRSPSVFALPSRFGFRPAPRQDGSALTIPDTRPDPTDGLLTYRPGSGNLEPLTIDAHMPDVREIRQASAPSVFKPRRPTDAFMIDVVWRDSKGMIPVRTFDVQAGPPWTSDKPWEAVVYVRLGRAGWPREVFFERATESKDRNAALLRIVETLNIPGRGEGDAGRLTIEYRPRREEGNASS